MRPTLLPLLLPMCLAGACQPPAADDDTTSAAITFPDPDAPSPPELTVDQLLFGGVDLKLVDRSSNEAGFQLFRRVGSVTAPWQLLTSFGPANGGGTVSFYYDTDVSLGTFYQYKARAFLGEHFGDSLVVSALTYPRAPHSVMVDEQQTTSLRVSWEANTSSVSQFGITVERQDRGESARQIMVPVDRRDSTVTGLTPGAFYCVRVVAYNGTGGNFDPAEQACGHTHALPGPLPAGTSDLAPKYFEVKLKQGGGWYAFWNVCNAVGSPAVTANSYRASLFVGSDAIALDDPPTQALASGQCVGVTQDITLRPGLHNVTFNVQPALHGYVEGDRTNNLEHLAVRIFE